MSKILVKEDQSGKEYFVEYWVSQKGNLCWRIEETLFVKLQNGHTSMLIDGNWKKANIHTKAKIQSAELPKAELAKAETVRLVL